MPFTQIRFTKRFFVAEMENIVVWLADNKISKELLLKLISSLIMGDEYPEELKLELFEAVGIDEL